MFKGSKAVVLLAAISSSSLSQAAFITLYDQDFESPNGFAVGSGYFDVSQQTVNDLYSGQPSGFSFAQTNTVETILLTGEDAFGTGYTDVSGIGGNYALGMLSDVQDDKLGLSFNIGGFAFFNFSLDISSLGLDGNSANNGPFASPNLAPNFKFTLFDNPGGALSTGGGAVLGTANLSGVASDVSVLDWTNGAFSFNASGSTDGNVTLQVDLFSGGYAAFDNFKITASDEAGEGITGDPVSVPTPATLALFGLGLAGLGWSRRKRA